MTKFNLCLMFVFCVLITSCAHFAKQNDKKFEPTSEEVSLYHSASNALEEKNIIIAESLFNKLLALYPNSQYKSASELGLALIRIENDDCPGAITILDKVIASTRQTSKEISGRGIYARGLCFFSQNKDEKYLASLLEAQAILDKLLPELSYVEIPAKLAAYYSAKGEEKLSKTYLDQVDHGIRYLEAQPNRPLDKAWLAKIYFNVGTLTTQKLNSDNFELQLKSFSILSRYLIKSVALDATPWSKKSKDLFLYTLDQYWIIINSATSSKSNDEAVKKQSDEQMLSKLNHFLKLLNDYQNETSSTNIHNKSIQEINISINKHILAANNLLFHTSEITPKTNELNTPKDDDSINKILDKKDPNL